LVLVLCFLQAERAVRKTQWLSYGSHEAAVNLQGKNILIVDEVRRAEVRLVRLWRPLLAAVGQ
jgi:hypothetical protein